VDEHAGPVDALGKVGVPGRPGQFGKGDEQVKSCGDALHAGAGQVLAQRAEQGITPGPLPLADLADVALEFPGGDQLGQH